MKARDILKKIDAWRKLVNLIIILDANAQECGDAALRTVTHQLMSHISIISAYEIEEDEC